jgi:hypothetical protein
MPIKKVDGKYQYGTEGKAYKTYAKAARQGAAIKASRAAKKAGFASKYVGKATAAVSKARDAATKAKRHRLACEATDNAHPSCRADSPKKTAGVSHSGREGGGAHRKQIWSGAGRTGDLVSYAHGTQTGTEEQDAEKAAITRKIRAHNEAQKKKRG